MMWPKKTNNKQTNKNVEVKTEWINTSHHLSALRFMEDCSGQGIVCSSKLWMNTSRQSSSMTFLTHLNRRSARTTNSSLCGLISFSMILPCFFTKSRQYKEGWGKKKKKRLGTKELMFSNHGTKEDSWESLGLQRYQISQS